MDAPRKTIIDFLDANAITCDRGELERNLLNPSFTTGDYKNMMYVIREVSVADPTRQRATMTMYCKDVKYDTEHIYDKNYGEYFITRVNTQYKYEIGDRMHDNQIFITNFCNIGVMLMYDGEQKFVTILNKHAYRLPEGMIDAIRLIFMETEVIKYENIEKFLDEIAPN